jgi:hypothetical protein
MLFLEGPTGITIICSLVICISETTIRKIMAVLRHVMFMEDDADVYMNKTF